jgi:serine/threonine protein kinase
MLNRVGTPYYMSPDVLRGKYDRSCDLGLWV